MEVPKKKIIRVKTKDEVLQQQQQQKLAPMFCKVAPSEPQKVSSTPKPAPKPAPKPTTQLSSTSDLFLKTLDEKELIAYNIAKSHLGLLFSLDRSNCYLEWLEKQ